MTKNKIFKIINVFAFIIMIVINVLATFSLIGYSTKEISDSIPTLLMPIGITFSIVWSVIYLLLLIYTVYQLFTKNKEINLNASILYLMTCLLNTLWVLAFHTKLLLLSTIIIVMLLVALARLVKELSFANKLTRITFSIYYGWITTATIVSVFSYISSLENVTYDSTFLKALTAIAIVALMVMTIIRAKDYAYVLTIIAAMVGIMFKHAVDYKFAYPEIMIVLVATGIIAILSFISSLNRKKDENHEILEM